jgi:hypothetical protein
VCIDRIYQYLTVYVPILLHRLIDKFGHRYLSWQIKRASEMRQHWASAPNFAKVGYFLINRPPSTLLHVVGYFIQSGARRD